MMQLTQCWENHKGEIIPGRRMAVQLDQIEAVEELESGCYIYIFGRQFRVEENYMGVIHEIEKGERPLVTHVGDIQINEDSESI